MRTILGTVEVGEREEPRRLVRPLPKRGEIQVEELADAAFGVHDFALDQMRWQIDEFRRDIRNEDCLCLSPPSFDPVHQQSKDQGGLKHGEHSGAGYRPAVMLPEPRLSKLDEAIGQQGELTDAPAPKFAPVVDRVSSFQDLRRNTLRPFTAQDPDRGAGALRAHFDVLIQPTADGVPG